jgi:hypothetical protein
MVIAISILGLLGVLLWIMAFPLRPRGLIPKSHTASHAVRTLPTEFICQEQYTAQGHRVHVNASGVQHGFVERAPDSTTARKSTYQLVPSSAEEFSWVNATTSEFLMTRSDARALAADDATLVSRFRVVPSEAAGRQTTELTMTWSFAEETLEMIVCEGDQVLMYSAPTPIRTSKLVMNAAGDTMLGTCSPDLVVHGAIRTYRIINDNPQAFPSWYFALVASLTMFLTHELNQSRETP